VCCAVMDGTQIGRRRKRLMRHVKLEEATSQLSVSGVGIRSRRMKVIVMYVEVYKPESWTGMYVVRTYRCFQGVYVVVVVVVVD